METGSVVEYIDRQKIIIAVVMEAKGDRIRLLNDANREVKLSAGRILHKSRQRLHSSLSRDRQIEALKEIACRRKELADQINLRELWEVLNSEQQRIDLKIMTELCFPEDPSEDCESAVLRTFFNDKLYFRFSPDGFFPNTEEQVRQLQIQAQEAERKNRLIELGGLWLKSAMSGNGHVRPPSLTSEEQAEITEILKSLYLHEKESKHYVIGKEITDKAGINDSDILFQILVRLNVWNQNENIDNSIK
jgi:exoribonuclease-2